MTVPYHCTLTVYLYCSTITVPACCRTTLPSFDLYIMPVLGDSFVHTTLRCPVDVVVLRCTFITIRCTTLRTVATGCGWFRLVDYYRLHYVRCWFRCIVPVLLLRCWIVCCTGALYSFCRCCYVWLFPVWTRTTPHLPSTTATFGVPRLICHAVYSSFTTPVRWRSAATGDSAAPLTLFCPFYFTLWFSAAYRCATVRVDLREFPATPAACWQVTYIVRSVLHLLAALRRYYCHRVHLRALLMPDCTPLPFRLFRYVPLRLISGCLWFCYRFVHSHSCCRHSLLPYPLFFSRWLIALRWMGAVLRCCFSAVLPGVVVWFRYSCSAGAFTTVYADSVIIGCCYVLIRCCWWLWCDDTGIRPVIVVLLWLFIDDDGLRLICWRNVPGRYRCCSAATFCCYSVPIDDWLCWWLLLLKILRWYHVVPHVVHCYYRWPFYSDKCSPDMLILICSALIYSCLPDYILLFPDCWSDILFPLTCSLFILNLKIRLMIIGLPLVTQFYWWFIVYYYDTLFIPRSLFPIWPLLFLDTCCCCDTYFILGMLRWYVPWCH